MVLVARIQGKDKGKGKKKKLEGIIIRTMNRYPRNG